MDNGWFFYAKDIGRVLAKTHLNNSHRAIIDAILDKTYGWIDNKIKHKKPWKRRKISEIITYKYFRDFTGIENSNLSKNINELINWKIIKREKNGKYFQYCLNVNVCKWSKEVFRAKYKKEIMYSNNPEDYSLNKQPKVIHVNKPMLCNEITKKCVKANKDKGFKGSNKPIISNYINKGNKGMINTLNFFEEEKIFNYWNKQNINNYNDFELFKEVIKKTLKYHNYSEIIMSIENYAIILKGEDYYYDYIFSLYDFLEPKNIAKFIDLEIAKSNYRKKDANINHKEEEYNILPYKTCKNEKNEVEKSEEERVKEKKAFGDKAGEFAKKMKRDILKKKAPWLFANKE